MVDDAAPGGSGGSGELSSEVARLREENARLEGQLQAVEQMVDAGANHPPRHRGRWFASWVLIVVGSLLVPVSVMSIWINRTITDTDRYVETVSPLIRDPAIQQAIERRLENALYERVDLGAEVQKVLPDQATMLAAPITAGLKNLISEVIGRVVTSERVAKLWDDANRIAQQQVVDVLTVSNGKKGVVEIDLSDTLKEVQSRLAEAGVPFVDNITVPKVQLEVMQSDTLAQVQTAFGIFDRLVTILPWLTLLILGAGIAVAPDRRNGADVGRQPARATRVAGVEHQDAGRSGVVFVKILGRQVGGRWGSGRGVCHHMAWSWCANYGGCARPSGAARFLCPVLLLQRWCVVTA